MNLPLYRGATARRRDAGGHAGLWFDKFCDRWRIEQSTWTLKGDDRNNPKLAWINTLTSGTVGEESQIREAELRLAALVERRGGRWEVFTTASRFVTGLGCSHPVENGFAWHPTLGTPFLPGSSIKGLVRSWAERDADPRPDGESVECLLGSPRKAGSICFLDAIPVEPVPLEAEVMTPHYAGWDKGKPTGRLAFSHAYPLPGHRGRDFVPVRLRSALPRLCMGVELRQRLAEIRPRLGRRRRENGGRLRTL